ncbi:MAG: SMP-30/gluconolactonase/LRE family protein [Bacteroidota bacterium]
MLNAGELKPEVVLEFTCLLGEGPVWDAKRNTICWIDILKGHIHQYSLESKNHSTIALNEMIGSMAVCSDGNFIAALKNGFVFIDRDSKHIQRITHPKSTFL